MKTNHLPLLAASAWLCLAPSATPGELREEADEKSADPSPEAAGVVRPAVDLSMALLLGTTPVKLRFTLRNRGAEEFSTTPIATNHNKIIITPDGGESIEHGFPKRNIDPVIIPAGESRHWDVDILRLLDFEKCSDPGTYQIIWSIDDIRSEPFEIVRE